MKIKGTHLAVGLGLLAAVAVVAVVVVKRRPAAAPAAAVAQPAAPVAPAAPAGHKPSTAEKVAGWAGLGLNLFGQAQQAGLFKF